MAFTVGANPAAADGDGEISYDGLELPYPNTSVTRFGDSVRAVTTNPELITISEAAIDRHFEASDLEGREYEETREYVADLRKNHPVEHITKGNETVIELESDVTVDTIAPGSDEPEKQRLHQQAVDVFAGEGSGPTVGPNWAQGHHRDITEVLMEDTIGVDYTTVYSSDDPDDWGDDAKGRVNDIGGQIDLGPLNVAKSVVVDMVAGALDIYHSNYSQYYDPSIGSIPLGSLGSADVPVAIGRANDAGDAFFEEAINASSSYTQEKKLGWSIHYLQDCAQPLHTSMGLEQAGLTVYWDGFELTWGYSKKKWLHHAFEGLVYANWESVPSFGNDDLKSYMSAAGAPSRIYSARVAIEDMAGVSTPYGDDVYYTILNNETAGSWYDDWSDYTKGEVYEDLSNCYSTLGYLGHGFCEEWEMQT